MLFFLGAFFFIFSVLSPVPGMPEASDAEAAPSASAAAGPQVTKEGTLEILNWDLLDGKHSFTRYYLKSGGERLQLIFPQGHHAPSGFLTGDKIHVTGTQSGSALLLEQSPSAVAGTFTSMQAAKTQPPPSPTILPNTLGAQHTIIILVNFQDNTSQPFTAAEVQNFAFGTGNTLNSFMQENSYGQTSFTGDVIGWYTMPMTVSSCTLDGMATYAQNFATANGYNLANYSRQVYFFPQVTSCSGEGFGGTSTVGGNPSQTWINGGGTLQLLDHEMGHAFGLLHSHLLDCGTSATICSNGSIVEYGDLIDTMGTPQDASFDFNAFQKSRLGWLGYGSSPTIQTVTANGTYTINAYESTGPGPKALKALQSTDPTTGAKTWYYLEARRGIGFDSPVANEFAQNETTGVLFHLGTDGNAGSSDLLDMTPATPTTGWYYDPSLAAGQSFADATAGVSFTVISVSSAAATVQVSFGKVTVAGTPPNEPGGLALH